MCYFLAVTRDEIKRVIGYVRVSTEEQDDSGAGLESQRRGIAAKAREKGWELVQLRKDVASGKSMNGRHELRAALGDLKARKADALVVAKLDRLSRSVMDFAQLLELARKQGWHVVMLDLELDTSTPMGEAMANMAVTFAQFERRMIGLRTKEALAVKKAQGVRLGRQRMVSPAIEKRIRSMRSRGLSYEAIAARLNSENVLAPAGGRWIWTSVSRIVNRGPVRTVRLIPSGHLMEVSTGELVSSPA
jgi:DNA invertase Pin-like site-specific DNA recombinase